MRWAQFTPIRLREHAPAAALLIIAWLVCAYFYEKLVALRAQNRGLVLALEENARILAQRNQQLSTWSSLSHSLITNLNLPRLLDLIVRTAAEVTESDCAAALLWEKQSRHLRLAAIHQRGLQIELAEKVAAAVIQSGQPLVVCRETAPPEFSRPDLPWEDLVCVASEPLVTRDQVVGALLVGRVRPRACFGDEVMQVLDSFAGQASIALEKADLYAENQRQLDRLGKLLDDLSIAQQQLLDSERIAGLGVSAAAVGFVVRGPLARAAGQSRRLLAEHTQDEAQIRRALAAIEDEAGRAGGLLSGLVALGRGASVGREMVDLNQMLEETLAVLRPQCAAQGVVLEEDYGSVLGVKANRGHLQRALLDVLLGALEAMPRGGKLILRTRCPRSGRVHVEVEDTRDVSGEGMEMLPATAADRLAAEEPLAAAARLLRAQGGEMAVDEQTGRGMRVQIRLPVARELPQALEAEAPPPAPEPAATSAESL